MTLTLILEKLFSANVRGQTTHLSVCKVMSPQRPDFVLATNIPNSKGYILIFHCLDIKTFGKENIREELIKNAIKIKDITTE